MPSGGLRTKLDGPKFQLVFRTPSRKCPHRHMNGSVVTLRFRSAKRKTKRSGWVDVYVVATATAIFIAYSDELFIERVT